MRMEYITLNNGLKIPQIGFGMRDAYDGGSFTGSCCSTEIRISSHMVQGKI